MTLFTTITILTITIINYKFTIISLYTTKCTQLLIVTSNCLTIHFISLWISSTNFSSNSTAHRVLTICLMYNALSTTIKNITIFMYNHMFLILFYKIPLVSIIHSRTDTITQMQQPRNFSLWHHWTSPLTMSVM